MSPARARHVPLRRCAVCRRTLPQSELIRFARQEDGRWSIDPGRRAGGRGMWVCRQESCHERKALGRAFRGQAGDAAEQLAALDLPVDDRSNDEASRNGGIDV